MKMFFYNINFKDLTFTLPFYLQLTIRGSN